MMLLYLLKSLFFFISIIPSLIRELIVQYFYFRTQINPIVKAYFSLKDGSIKKKDSFRIWYYGIYIPVFLGYGFSILRGKSVNRNERKILSLFAAATPLFDDFFDHSGLDPERLRLYFTQRESFVPQNEKEQLLFQLLLAIKPLIKNEEAFIQTSYLNFEAHLQALQIESDPLVPFATIKKNNHDKGGYTTLLFWLILDEEESKAWNTLIFQAGIMIQLSDDIFDIWFDFQNGAKTSATNCNSVDELYQEYRNELNKLIQYVNQADTSLKNKRRFLSLFFLFLSRVEVAVQQLQTLPVSKPFNPQIYTRKELVCDMALLKNNMKWLNYYYSYKTKLP